LKVLEFIRASIDHPERCEDAIMTFPNGDGKAPVFAVIDGMGGHQRTTSDGALISGREAAQVVRQTFIEDLTHFPSDVDASPGGVAEQKVIAALRRAHERINTEFNQGSNLPINECVGAVATVVVVCENGSRLLVGQVGDTRAYLFSGGELIQLCYDEDNIEYLVSTGVMSSEDGAKISAILNTFDGVNEPDTEGIVTINGQPYELYLAWRWFLVGNTVLNIPAANIVIKSLGIHEELPAPQLSRIEIAPDEPLFLCSDGAYKNLTEAEMIDGLMQEDSANVIGELAYERSQSMTNRRSTQDDISAVVVRW
jgi:serine/threonine protein phosphatase PrpC